KSGQAIWRSYDLKSNLSWPEHGTNLLYYPGERFFSRNKASTVNTNNEWLQRYKTMQLKNFHRQPTELSKGLTKRFPLSSMHELRSQGHRVTGRSASRQQVIPTGSCTHLRTRGRWTPAVQGVPLPTSYQRDGDLSIRAPDVFGNTPAALKGSTYLRNRL